MWRWEGRSWETLWSFWQHLMSSISFSKVPVGREASGPGEAHPCSADCVCGVSCGCPLGPGQLWSRRPGPIARPLLGSSRAACLSQDAELTLLDSRNISAAKIHFPRRPQEAGRQLRPTHPRRRKR